MINALAGWMARRFAGAARTLGHIQFVPDAQCMIEPCDCGQGCGYISVYLWSGETRVVASMNRETAADLGDALVSHAFRTAQEEEG